jgi:hypothetical protein
MDEEDVFADADIWKCNMKKLLKKDFSVCGAEESGSF